MFLLKKILNAHTSALSCRGVLLAYGICIALLVHRADASDYVPRHEGARVLFNDQLTIEVMDHAAENRYNNGTRFLPFMVLRAVRDGRDYFYSPVEHDPEYHAAGLAFEFDGTNPLGAPGYYEARYGEADWEDKLGDGFLKIGVGALRRDRPRYHFYWTKEIIHLAESKVEWGTDGAVFTQTCEPIDGFAYHLQVELSLVGDTIELHYRLTNTGEKPIVTEAYVHTFFRFNDEPVGPNYSVDFPYPIDPFKFKVSDLIGEDSVTFKYLLTEPTTVKLRVPEEGIDPNVLTAKHANGQFVEARVSGQPVGRVSVHASLDYISPEQFILLLIEPGKSREWSTSYRLGMHDEMSAAGLK
ncbi:MAG: hypothetical protein ACQKBV_11830 [Puniceicoccales bacterium]